MKSLYIEEYDSLVSYYDLGESEDIILYLPGLNSPAMPLFAEIVTHPLFTGYRSILVDYFGCGMSDSPTGFDHDMESHANVVMQILNHEQISSCKIFGHSMGGTVGIYLANIRSDLVTKLAIAESNLYPGGGDGTKWVTSFSEQDWINIEFPNYIKNLRNQAKKGNPISTSILALWKDADPRGIYRSAVSLVTLPETFHQKFYNLTIPRFFLFGEQNFPQGTKKPTPDTPDSEELLRYGVEPVIVANSGHFMFIDNLQGLIGALQKCLG